MRYTFVLMLLVFGSVQLFSQLVPEHEYAGFNVFRVNLELDGEKYVECLPATKKVNLYNADHTLWKSITPDMPLDSVRFMYCWDMTQTSFLDDATVEFSLLYDGYKDGNFSSGANLFKENGAILSNESGNIYTVNGAKKWLTTYHVYGLPGLNLEHTYSTDFQITQIDGADYYTTLENNQLKVYFDNFTLWKTVNIPVIANTFASIHGVSQHLFNNDPSLEVMIEYKKFGSTEEIGRIVNEAGQVLFERLSGSGYYINSRITRPEDGFSTPKLLINTHTEDSTLIFSVPGLGLEHQMDYYMDAIPLDQEGICTYPHTVKAGKSSFDIIKMPDYTPWYSFPKPVGETWHPTFFSRHLIDGDDDLEFGYAVDNAPGSNEYAFLVKDMTNGQTILSEPKISFAAMSYLPGAQPKLLLVKRAEPQSGSFTKVYGFSGSTGTSSSDFNPIAFTVSPNPGSGPVTINLTEPATSPVKVSVYTIQGQCCYQTIFATANNFSISADVFASKGVYFLQIETGNRQGLTQLVRM